MLGGIALLLLGTMSQFMPCVGFDFDASYAALAPCEAFIACSRAADRSASVTTGVAAITLSDNSKPMVSIDDLNSVRMIDPNDWLSIRGYDWAVIGH
jgi:hypothetical protein